LNTVSCEQPTRPSSSAERGDARDAAGDGAVKERERRGRRERRRSFMLRERAGGWS
jgi:hypothetical protein